MGAFSIRVEQHGEAVLVVVRKKGKGAARFQLSAAQARFLSGELLGAAAGADPAGHRVMMEAAGRELREEASQPLAPTYRTH